MKITITLFVVNSVEAAEFYVNAFDFSLESVFKNPDGSYFHSELHKNGECFFSVIESPYGEPTKNPMSIEVRLDNADEVYKAYNVLKEDVKSESPQPLPWCPLSFSIIDKYGIAWWIYTDNAEYPDGYDPKIEFESFNEYHELTQ